MLTRDLLVNNNKVKYFSYHKPSFVRITLKGRSPGGGVVCAYNLINCDLYLHFALYSKPRDRIHNKIN